MLIAVESMDYRHRKSNSSCGLYGNIKPIAVIVCGPDGVCAFDMEAKPTALEPLRQDIPELDAIIAAFTT